MLVILFIVSNTAVLGARVTEKRHMPAMQSQNEASSDNNANISNSFAMAGSGKVSEWWKKKWIPALVGALASGGCMAAACMSSACTLGPLCAVAGAATDGVVKAFNDGMGNDIPVVNDIAPGLFAGEDDPKSGGDTEKAMGDLSKNLMNANSSLHELANINKTQEEMLVTQKEILANLSNGFAAMTHATGLLEDRASSIENLLSEIAADIKYDSIEEFAMKVRTDFYTLRTGLALGPAFVNDPTLQGFAKGNDAVSPRLYMRQLEEMNAAILGAANPITGRVSKDLIETVLLKILGPRPWNSTQGPAGLKTAFELQSYLRKMALLQTQAVAVVMVVAGALDEEIYVAQAKKFLKTKLKMQADYANQKFPYRDIIHDHFDMTNRGVKMMVDDMIGFDGSFFLWFDMGRKSDASYLPVRPQQLLGYQQICFNTSHAYGFVRVAVADIELPGRALFPLLQVAKVKFQLTPDMKVTMQQMYLPQNISGEFEGIDGRKTYNPWAAAMAGSARLDFPGYFNDDPSVPYAWKDPQHHPLVQESSVKAGEYSYWAIDYGFSLFESPFQVDLSPQGTC